MPPIFNIKSIIMSFADDFGHNIPPDDYDGGGYRRRRKSYYNTMYNPLFETHRKSFKKITYETKKAYLLEFLEGNAWVPKSKIRMFLKEQMISLPKWLLNNLEFLKQ